MNKGFIFLEIVIAVALVGIVFTSLLQVGALVLNVSSSVQRTDQAAQLLKEEMEAVRSFRDGSSWSSGGLGSAATDTAYHMALSTGSPAAWQLQSGTETVNGFTRSVTFDLVSRDPSTQDIQAAYNAGDNDPNTRKVTVTVAYGSSSWQTVAYLTNWNQ